MKKTKYFFPKMGIGILLTMFTSCLAINAKKIVDAPYYPPEEAFADAGEQEKNFKVYYSGSKSPVIDGEFNEWDGLDGIRVRRMVYGGMFNPENTDGLFKVRADDSYLYVFADIIDDQPQENKFPAPQGWRDDSIEFFFGTDTSYHTFYKSTDHRVRIVPQSKTNKSAYDVSLNDVSMNGSIKAAIVYSEHGYKIEAAVPFSLLSIKKLKPKQKVRGDFQINDADDGKERSRLIHWNSSKDNTYVDASSWGDGIVVDLAEAENE
ncbi:Carbohydrate family 9 binding domain-like [Treponema bryantii]|uniref:Carbohydrate family 9 binding domain-like n=1 Tax=Treponema bryantii TaxID=163 RepID=A0A1H9CMS0_9SPIR|nr:sugar-binding protein [Treponema bryantii]SEQ02469.1 Carbohydrate family 9 binding domain-like [Treponema bryantii]